MADPSPLAQPAPAPPLPAPLLAASAAPVAVPSAAAWRVLVADPDLTGCSALGLLLGREPGLRLVGEATDLPGLLAATAASQPHLVLLDWALLGGQAVVGLAALHQRCPTAKVVALSTRPELREAVLATGVAAFVSKVEPPSHLLGVLHTLLVGTPWATPPAAPPPAPAAA